MSFVQYLLSVLAGLQYSKVPHPGGASPYDLPTRQVLQRNKEESEHTSSSIASHNASLAMPQQVCQCRSRVSAAEVLEATATYHVNCRAHLGERQSNSAAAPSLPSCPMRITLIPKRRPVLHYVIYLRNLSSRFLQICPVQSLDSSRCSGVMTNDGKKSEAWLPLFTQSSRRSTIIKIRGTEERFFRGVAM